MTNLTKEELLSVAERALLFIADEEADLYTEQLGSIINHLDKLNELDTEGVVPMTHTLQYVNVMRSDTVENVLDREEMLKGVKEHKAGAIKVPAIL